MPLPPDASKRMNLLTTPGEALDQTDDHRHERNDERAPHDHLERGEAARSGHQQAENHVNQALKERDDIGQDGSDCWSCQNLLL